MKGTEWLILATVVLVGIAAGLGLATAVDPLEPPTELVAGGTEAVKSRNDQAESLLVQLEEADKRGKAAKQRGDATGKAKADQDYSRINKELAALLEVNRRYGSEAEEFGARKADPGRRKHFILYAVGGAAFGLVVGCMLVFLMRGPTSSDPVARSS
jgi:hypothetical protein